MILLSTHSVLTELHILVRCMIFVTNVDVTLQYAFLITEFVFGIYGVDSKYAE